MKVFKFYISKVFSTFLIFPFIYRNQLVMLIRKLLISVTSGKFITYFKQFYSNMHAGVSSQRQDYRDKIVEKIISS